MDIHTLAFLAQTAIDPRGAKLIAAGLAMGLGAIGPGVGLGLGVLGATQAIGRNPEAEGPVRTTMILGMAFAEAVAIYALVTAIIILFAPGDIGK